jgi:adenylate/nucleoside-diphosphate kinase
MYSTADINYELEMNTITTALGFVKEAYGEENVKEVTVLGTVQEVVMKVRTAIDPFYIRFDDETLV